MRRLDKTHKACANCMFPKKHNKNAENNKNSDKNDGFGEDIVIENAEYEEELVKQK